MQRPKDTGIILALLWMIQRLLARSESPEPFDCDRPDHSFPSFIPDFPSDHSDYIDSHLEAQYEDMQTGDFY